MDGTQALKSLQNKQLQLISLAFNYFGFGCSCVLLAIQHRALHTKRPFAAKGQGSGNCVCVSKWIRYLGWTKLNLFEGLPYRTIKISLTKRKPIHYLHPDKNCGSFFNCYVNSDVTWSGVRGTKVLTSGYLLLSFTIASYKVLYVAHTTSTARLWTVSLQDNNRILTCHDAGF